MTPEEVAQLMLDREAGRIAREKLEADQKVLADLKASAKVKLVTGQPLTEEEAATIVIGSSRAFNTYSFEQVRTRIVIQIHNINSSS